MAIHDSRREELQRNLERRTVEELRHSLRLNNQRLGGTKAELLRRVVDGVLHGALPPCPLCGGHVQLDADSRFRCHKLTRDREPCGYEVSRDEMVRIPYKG
jgi:hypothetical protein